jgi:hypothetical protein
VLLLACSPIVLAGCQHPLAPAQTNPAWVHAEATDRVKTSMPLPATSVEEGDFATELDSPGSLRPNEASQVASSQKEPEHLTLELGDAFVLLLKTMTGR